MYMYTMHTTCLALWTRMAVALLLLKVFKDCIEGVVVRPSLAFDCIICYSVCHISKGRHV